MRSFNLCILITVLLLPLVTNCQNEEAAGSDDAEVPVEQLDTYDTLPANEDLLLGLPVGVKYDQETQHLFIQDINRSQIIEVDHSGKVVQTYGSEGRGPGEVQALTNFFVTAEHLFIVDITQYVIHKYSLTDGQHISTLDYGPLLQEKTPPTLPYIDVNNLPFVTQNETILLPSQAGGEYLYQVINWEGEKLADLGEIPAGYAGSQENDEIRAALENKEVPARDSTLAFPVNDRANPDEIFLVYSAIPKIAKYNLSGEKLWERNIPETPEVDSLVTGLSELVSDNPNRSNFLVPVRKYVTGRSSPNGELYLFTYTNLQLPPLIRPMWMHKFNSEGKFVSRYKIVSDSDLSYFADIDFSRERLFLPVFQGTDIRIYSF